MNSFFPRTSIARGPGPRWADPGGLLVPAAAAFGALSLVGWWWGLPTAIAAFVAGRGPGRGRTVVVVLAGMLVAGAVAVVVAPSLLALGTQFVAVVVLAVLVPWFVGRFSRQYRELVRAGWERAEQLEREKRLVAEQARLLERARIARDMHDVLGHDLSLIALSAGALKLAPGLDERHRQAAQDIRGRAGAAVERLGEVIGVLREESEGPPEGPRDADIARLVGAAAASGLDVELTVAGEAAAGLPPAVERAAHRVVQEGLTNAAKHAPGRSVSVELSHTATETRVVVRDGDPATSPGTPGELSAGYGGRGRAGHAERGRAGYGGGGLAGHGSGGLAGHGERGRAGHGSGVLVGHGGRGLIGLDERVRLVGGTLDHGPRDGGFTVDARLPHHAPAQPAPRPAADGVGPGPAGYRRARRRVRRTLLTALAVPLAAGAVLLAGVGMWETVAASRSVLDPRDYARLRVGQDRADIRKVLPDRQSVERPAGAGPEERGVTCEFYAMTADRFDDRSGDAYRLCFRDGRLVFRDALTP
ncbi:sensor histidine kinase [Streptomyces sp. VB1]|uniref:sensor histidine kinase n=1 Tax=Streptomyces sp. VB1 TaxID=2986803 RepID=UPI002242C5A7|nr:histidine kinase [Streptomyces sp. VB1]UZI31175.1 histidine kinase [Streptomyces sp. VB1]